MACETAEAVSPLVPRKEVAELMAADTYKRVTAADKARVERVVADLCARTGIPITKVYDRTVIDRHLARRTAGGKMR